MIQRIQTLWFLLVITCGILLMTGGLLAFSSDSGVSYTFGFKGLSELSGDKAVIVKISPAFQIALIVNILTAMVAIFFYSKRVMQKSLALASALVSLALQVLVIYIGYRTVTGYGVHLTGWIKAGLPLLMTAASLLAWKGIDRDDKIVKSYDRLR